MELSSFLELASFYGGNIKLTYIAPEYGSICLPPYKGEVLDPISGLIDNYKEQIRHARGPALFPLL